MKKTAFMLAASCIVMFLIGVDSKLAWALIKIPETVPYTDDGHTYTSVIAVLNTLNGHTNHLYCEEDVLVDAGVDERYFNWRCGVAGQYNHYIIRTYDPDGNNVYDQVIESWGPVTSGGDTYSGFSDKTILTSIDIVDTENHETVRFKANFSVPHSISDLHHFEFSNISSSQFINVLFPVTITAKNANGNTVTGFNGSVTLSSSMGNVTPSVINLVNGIWSGIISVDTLGSNIQIVAVGGGKQGESSVFNVQNATVLYLDLPINAANPYNGLSGNEALTSGNKVNSWFDHQYPNLYAP